MSKKLKNNIVIVCEGTDTETGYLQELAQAVRTSDPERFSDIRVVPTEKELKECEKRNQDIKKRKLRPASGIAGWYYNQGEPLDADFQRYRMQPTRYVREAQLYLEDKSYTEAWAVYDKDDFTDHENARKLADSEPKVNIAFSSVSFEEWLLLHFELNRKAFAKSVCKKEKKDIECGTGRHPADCHGETCLGGRLRECGYLPDYAKKGSNLYSRLAPRLDRARIGAAWTRSLNPDESEWIQNPYTDFDRLVSSLLGISEEYEWKSYGSEIADAHTKFLIANGSLTNTGNAPLIEEMTVYDEDFNIIATERVCLDSGETKLFATGEYISFCLRGAIAITPLHPTA